MANESYYKFVDDNDMKYEYHKISNIRGTKSQILNVSHLVLQLSLPNPLKSGVKSRMKMYLEQRLTTSEWSTILLPFRVWLILEVLRYSHNYKQRNNSALLTA